jgi:hypothetical protein
MYYYIKVVWLLLWEQKADCRLQFCQQFNAKEKGLILTSEFSGKNNIDFTNG